MAVCAAVSSSPGSRPSSASASAIGGALPHPADGQLHRRPSIERKVGVVANAEVVEHEFGNDDFLRVRRPGAARRGAGFEVRERAGNGKRDWRGSTRPVSRHPSIAGAEGSHFDHVRKRRDGLRDCRG